LQIDMELIRAHRAAEDFGANTLPEVAVLKPTAPTARTDSVHRAFARIVVIDLAFNFRFPNDDPFDESNFANGGPGLMPS